MRMQPMNSGAGGGCGAAEADAFLRLPLDLQLDLLVDEELPEEVRVALLARLDSEPGRWRELSIRFLQRQVERRSVRELMDGGRVLPVDFEAAVRDEVGRLYRFPGMRWATAPRLIGVAAGLLIATTSVLVTVQVMGRRQVSPMVVSTASDTFQADLPGQSVGLERPLAVEVPMVNGVREDGRPWQFLGAAPDRPMPRRNVVIQPDGSGNAVVIPVNTMPLHVY
jgi:hypothetical protein